MSIHALTSYNEAKKSLAFDPVEFADTSFLVYAEQIVDDYSKIIQDAVICNLKNLGPIEFREIRLISTVAFFSRPISLMLIAEILRIDPAIVYNSAQQLADKGKIKIHENVEDLWKVWVTLTPDGQAIAQNYIKKTRSTFLRLENYLKYDFSMQEKEQNLKVFSKVSNRARTMRSLVNSLNTFSS